MRLEPIGHVVSPYLTKFGVPRQPGLASAVRSHIVFGPGHGDVDSMLGLCRGDWILVLWCFSHNVERGAMWSKTVRPPILGGTARRGVFATRSSFRPNGLALSCVRIEEVGDGALHVIGGDMVDRTPVYDVYPYDSRIDCPLNSLGGWAEQAAWPLLERVEIDDANMERVSPELREGLVQVLLQDPRPAYTRSGQDGRVFWTAFERNIIWFTVADRVMNVVRIDAIDERQAEIIRETGNLPR